MTTAELIAEVRRRMDDADVHAGVMDKEDGDLVRLLAQRLEEARAAMREAIEYRHDYIGAYERLRQELSK